MFPDVVDINDYRSYEFICCCFEFKLKFKDCYLQTLNYIQGINELSHRKREKHHRSSFLLFQGDSIPSVYYYVVSCALQELSFS